MTDSKKAKKAKEVEVELDIRIKEIKQQLSDQLKCLDQRLEYQINLLGEIQEFYKKRADIELEHSKQLERLYKSYKPKSSGDRTKDFWRCLAPYDCWESVIKSTAQQHRYHAILHDVYANNISFRLIDLETDVQRLQKRCRETGLKAHEQIIKCLNELQTSLKRYNMVQQEYKLAEAKLESAKREKDKQKSNERNNSKKIKQISKLIEKKEAKYSNQKKEAYAAKNEYILCIEAANAALNRFYVSNIYELIDTLDHGYHASLRNIFLLHVNCNQEAVQAQIACNEHLEKMAREIDTQIERQILKDNYRPIFAVPPPFGFQRHVDDDTPTSLICQPNECILLERMENLGERIQSLKLTADENWKTLEATELSLSNVFLDHVADEAKKMFGDNLEDVKQLSSNYVKRRNDRMEQESYYLKKFEEYLINNNLMARLEAKYKCLKNALGDNKFVPKQLPPKPKSRPFRKNIFDKTKKLFGGTLEDAVDGTNHDVPLIIRSCIRVIVKFGLHHQGIFRVPGSQIEINEFRNAFERSEDPLADVSDGRDINSVAGVLKLYVRELREPLFPPILFDQLISCSESKDLVNKLHDLLINSIPRPVLVVMRYLFAFFNHLSEYSDENMMDPSNLAICLGPTVFPVPHDKDQVRFRGPVNDLIKTIIVKHWEIFPQEGGDIYDKFSITGDDTVDNLSDNEEEVLMDISVEDSSPLEKEKIDGREVTALYDFTGRTSLELSFTKGTPMRIYNKASDEWWRGSIKGRKGLIPANYISISKQSLSTVSNSSSAKLIEETCEKEEKKEDTDSSSTSSDIDSLDEANVNDELDAIDFELEERRTPDLVLDLPKRNADGTIVTSTAEAFASTTHTGTIKKRNSLDNSESKDAKVYEKNDNINNEKEAIDVVDTKKFTEKPPVKTKPKPAVLAKPKLQKPPDDSESNV